MDVIVDFFIVCIYIIIGCITVLCCTELDIRFISQEDLIKSLKRKLVSNLIWLGIGIVLILSSHYISTHFPMSRMETYTYWFLGEKQGTKKVVTAAYIWSGIMHFVGIVICIIYSIVSFDTYTKRMSLKSISPAEYAQEQERLKKKKSTKAKIIKGLKTAYQVYSVVNKINNLSN